jgi:GntR family transcriptional regulator/MocR family aminotransferase
MGISAGLGVVLELPDGGPSSEELIEEAAGRSIGLYPLANHYRDGEPPRDGIVLGYGAIPEHELEASLSALGDLLGDLLPPRA